MITVALIMLWTVAAGLAIGALAVATAPLGYEDETGFQCGSEQGTAFEEVGSGNPSWVHPASSHA